jgi:hypothetical protein
VQSPSTTQRPSQIEGLPVEILVQVVSGIPLPSLLSFLSASRLLRFKLLGFESDRDSMVRAWMQNCAPWYLPDIGSNDGAENKADKQISSEDVDTKPIGWGYLRRCVGDPSMKNRKRIWGIAQQLERMADDIGVW